MRKSLVEVFQTQDGLRTELEANDFSHKWWTIHPMDGYPLVICYIAIEHDHL